MRRLQPYRTMNRDLSGFAGESACFTSKINDIFRYSILHYPLRIGDSENPEIMAHFWCRMEVFPGNLSANGEFLLWVYQIERKGGVSIAKGDVRIVKGGIIVIGTFMTSES